MAEKQTRKPQLGPKERQIIEAFRRGHPDSVERERDGSVVLSVRIPRGTLKELTRLARERDEPAGRVARELIESGLAMEVGTASEVVLRAASRLAGERSTEPPVGVRLVIRQVVNQLNVPGTPDLDREFQRLIQAEREARSGHLAHAQPSGQIHAR